MVIESLICTSGNLHLNTIQTIADWLVVNMNPPDITPIMMLLDVSVLPKEVKKKDTINFLFEIKLIIHGIVTACYTDLGKQCSLLVDYYPRGYYPSNNLCFKYIFIFLIYSS